MSFTFRKSVRLGPVKLNFGRNGYTSTSIKLGRWSWNSRTRRHTVDLPGPINWRSRGGR